MVGKRLGMWFFFGVLGVLSVGQDECRPSLPPPAFDTTGTYTGTWEGMSTDDQEAMACPLTIVFAHDVDAGAIESRRPQGTLMIDFSCIDLPAFVDRPEARNVEATFLLQDDGKLASIVPVCSPNAPVCVLLGLDGEGMDEDGDGVMDSYSGDWSYRFLVPGIPAFGVDGTFMIERE